MIAKTKHDSRHYIIFPYRFPQIERQEIEMVWSISWTNDVVQYAFIHYKTNFSEMDTGWKQQ